MAIPSDVKYAVIGAGIHGLSTAYHLLGAEEWLGLTPPLTPSGLTRGPRDAADNNRLPKLLRDW